MSRVEFPEPTMFNGPDSRPMPSGGRDNGLTHRALRDAMFAAVRIYGFRVVRDCLDDVELWLRENS